jgi:hypothetical protein
MSKLTVGRIVHYVLPCCRIDPRVRPNAMGEHRPALVVNVRPDGRPVLSVFLDEHDAAEEGSFGLPVVGAVQDEEECLPDTWHWPERDE